MFSVGVLVILAIASSDGAPMSTMCGPHQFEASLMGSGGYVVNGQAMPLDFNGKTYYDYDNKMLRVDTMMYDATTGMTHRTTMYTMYNKKMRYTVTGGKCTAANYTAEMTDPCLPANATMLGLAVVGSQTHNIDVVTYSYHNAEYDNYVRLTISANDGTPIVQSMFPVSGTTQQNIIYTDYSRGISDPSVFNLPASCMAMTG